MRVAACVVLVACSHTPAPATVSLALPLPTAPITPVSEVRETRSQELDFASDHGPIHLVKDGDGFAGTFQDGVLTCTESVKTFTCHWYQSSSEGTAQLHRDGDRLEGTWDDEGADATPVGRGSLSGTLDGSWDTNWGPATITTNRSNNVHVDYVQGTADCTATDRKLACTWQEGGSGGGAELVIETQHVVRGRWGTGASATDGGVWVFVRR